MNEIYIDIEIYFMMWENIQDLFLFQNIANKFPYIFKCIAVWYQQSIWHIYFTLILFSDSKNDEQYLNLTIEDILIFSLAFTFFFREPSK